MYEYLHMAWIRTFSRTYSYTVTYGLHQEINTTLRYIHAETSSRHSCLTGHKRDICSCKWLMHLYLGPTMYIPWINLFIHSNNYKYDLNESSVHFPCLSSQIHKQMLLSKNVLNKSHHEVIKRLQHLLFWLLRPG